MEHASLFRTRPRFPIASTRRKTSLAWFVGVASTLIMLVWLTGVNSTSIAAQANARTEGGGTLTPTPGTCAISTIREGFESGNLGTQFTSTAPVCEWQFGDCIWSATTVEHNTGLYSANTPALADITDVRLTANDSFIIPSDATQATLEFWHVQAFEGGDGGVLETSTDGGATWQDAGANIIQGDYDTQLGGSGNPLAGRQGWGNYTFSTWGQVRVNLLPYAGHNFLFRFRLGTNNSGGTDGWYLDDIFLSITWPCTTGTVVPPTSTRTATPSATATPVCSPTWTRVASPDPFTVRSYLYDVEVIAPDDVWAVGQYNDSFGIDHSLIMHWDGTAWNLVTDPGVDSSGLYSVSAVRPDDIWAVGYYIPDEFGIFQPMAVHWDGTAWSVVSTPANAGFETTLQGVGAVTANDVWAVGDNENGPMIMHWNGSVWSVVSHPLDHYGNKRTPSKEDRPTLYYDSLYAVGVVSANDVWAVGTIGDQSLALHWDGTEWQVEGTPNPFGTVILRGIAVVSPSNIWAVGSTDYFMEDPQAVTIHWDGQNWSNVPAPAEDFVLNDVATFSHGDIWVVGYERVDDFTTVALLLYRSGSQWVRVPSPNSMPENQDELYGIAAVPNAVLTTDAWATGIYDGSTLIDRYNNPCGTPIPTSTATVTPQAVATTPPTSCPLQFTDVPPQSTFYPFVRCMVCRGIISGYSDSTFRPNNNVTRGQLAKIVSNTAGFADPPGSQLYQDVPAGATFYDYVQRLATRGIVGGYPCGGTGEPCVDPMDLPYFRPNTSATRRQISKIVAIARGWVDPTSTQTFEDVPPNSTFYLWIENLAAHGVMQGYPCGNPEPCGSGNRPYFRPQNNATRGQMSKIVANTFYPNCNPAQTR
jgi:hypothetical protein